MGITPANIIPRDLFEHLVEFSVFGTVVFFGWKKCRVMGANGVEKLRKKIVASGHEVERHKKTSVSKLISADSHTQTKLTNFQPSTHSLS